MAKQGTIGFDELAWAQLVLTAHETGVEIDQVMPDAFAFYLWFLDEQKQGNTLYIKRDGRLTEVLGINRG